MSGVPHYIIACCAGKGDCCRPKAEVEVVCLWLAGDAGDVRRNNPAGNVGIYMS